MKKKLFIVVNVDWFFLSHRKDIAISARKVGYQVTIITKDTGKIAEIEELGLQVIPLPINPAGSNLAEELITFSFLHTLYRKEKPDIVHHVGLKIILWGGLAAKFASVKGVVNAISGLGVFFSLDNTSFKSKCMRKVLLNILTFSHSRKLPVVAIFQNQDDCNLFLETKVIKKTQVCMINGSGVDMEKYIYTPEIENKKIKILFAARMVKEKGALVLVDAALKLKDLYKEKLEFILCGKLDNNPKAIRKEELEEVCDGDYIKWLGHYDNIPDLLKNIHIVAFPSYYREGIPKFLIEATAIGRPIITTDSIGCRETVIPGFNGYLVPIKDSDMLAEKLVELINNKQLRIVMGQNSRMIAEKKFSLQQVVEKHLEIYNSLTEKINK